MLFKREFYLKEIGDALALLELSTRNKGILHLFDQNIISENFIAELLNIIYGYNLINLNTIHQNFAATDLGDFQNKICFQVTYTSKNNQRSKVLDTINKLITYKLYEDFNHLKFLFLGPKQKKYYKGFETHGFFQFDPSRDIINLQDIIAQLPRFTTEKLGEVYNLITNEFHVQQINSNKSILLKLIDETKLKLNEIEDLANNGLTISNNLINELQDLSSKLMDNGMHDPRFFTLFSELIKTIHESNKLPRKPGRIDKITTFITESNFTKSIVDIRSLLGD